MVVFNATAQDARQLGQTNQFLHPTQHEHGDMLAGEWLFKDTTSNQRAKEIAMSEQRQKTVQYNFRISPELAEKFERHCDLVGISKTLFFENCIRQVLGEPLTLPEDAIGGKPLPERLASIEARLTTLEEELRQRHGD